MKQLNEIKYEVKIKYEIMNTEVNSKLIVTIKIIIITIIFY